MTRFAKGLKTKPRYVVKRSYKELDEIELKVKIYKLGWLELYLCEDVNIAARLLSDHINTVLNRLAPIRKKKTRNEFAPWILKETKILMEDRRKLHETAVDSQTE